MSVCKHNILMFVQKNPWSCFPLSHLLNFKKLWERSERRGRKAGCGGSSMTCTWRNLALGMDSGYRSMHRPAARHGLCTHRCTPAATWMASAVCSGFATGTIFGVVLFFIAFNLATDTILSHADSTLFFIPCHFTLSTWWFIQHNMLGRVCINIGKLLQFLHC